MSPSIHRSLEFAGKTLHHYPIPYVGNVLVWKYGGDLHRSLAARASRSPVGGKGSAKGSFFRCGEIGWHQILLVKLVFTLARRVVWNQR